MRTRYNLTCTATKAEGKKTITTRQFGYLTECEAESIEKEMRNKWTAQGYSVRIDLVKAE